MDQRRHNPRNYEAPRVRAFAKELSLPAIHALFLDAPPACCTCALEENLNFPLCLCEWVDMRSELLVAGFTDAQHQPWLTFYNAKVARRHKIESALPFHDYHRRNRRTLGERFTSRHFEQGHLKTLSSGKTTYLHFLPVNRPLHRTFIAQNLSSTMQ